MLHLWKNLSKPPLCKNESPPEAGALKKNPGYTTEIKIRKTRAIRIFIYFLITTENCNKVYRRHEVFILHSIHFNNVENVHLCTVTINNN